MSKKTAISGIDKRGEGVSALGLFVSLLGALVLAALAIWGRSSTASVWAVSFQMFAAAGIWMLCWLHQHQLRMMAIERLELDEIERQRQEKLGGVQTIFEQEELEQMDALSAGRRMRAIERIVVPILAVGISILLIAGAVALMPFLTFLSFPPVAESEGLAKYLSDPKNADYVKYVLFFAGGLSFAAFMMSRYALGLRRVGGFGGLRAGGNALFGSAILCIGLAITMVLVVAGFQQAEYWYTIVVSFVLLLLALEIVINFVLDVYRPRVEGEDTRPFYDSRLLGVFSEPGGVIESVGKFADYQFGFKVSDTWLYKLLSWQIPILVIILFAILFAMSSVVVVPPGHEAVIMRFGEPREKTAKAGMHLTMPWPIDRAEVIAVKHIQALELGHEAELEADGGQEGDDVVSRIKRLFMERKAEQQPEVDLEPDKPRRREPILWTKKHYAQEYKIVVGERVASVGKNNQSGELPVNLLNVVMPVYWRVKDGDDQVVRYFRQSRDAESLVESLAYRELTHFAATADIRDLLGDGGAKAAAVIHDRLQHACDTSGYDGKGLGVEIVFVGVGGIHPPSDENVAKAYEDVVGATEKMRAKIMQASADAAAQRIFVAGINWEELYDLILAEEAVPADNKAEAAAATAKVETFLRSKAGGSARMTVSVAVRDSYRRLIAEKSGAELYEQQVEAFESAPSTYMLRTYLRTMQRALEPVTKYVIAVEDSSRVIYNVDLKPPSDLSVLNAEIAEADKSYAKEKS